MIEIREERPGDVAAIRELNMLAFGQDQEGRIVDALRLHGAALLSLVATLDGQVVGHVMYSGLSVGDNQGAALGPMAVKPEHQRQGIGSQLIEAGNRKLKEAGCPFIVVVGHPGYYPRFGFRPASQYLWSYLRMGVTRRRLHGVGAGSGKDAGRCWPGQVPA